MCPVEPTDPPHLDPQKATVSTTLVEKIKKFLKKLFK